MMRTMRVVPLLACLALFTASASAQEAVSLGSRFGCGLTEEGTVRCWGRCDDGQCGSEGGNARTPRPVPGLDDVTQIDVGFGFGCALRGDGTVWCWGDNGWLQLGVEGVEERTEPAPVPGLTEVAEIALGGFHGCARRQNGQVLCWGNNGHGELGAPASVDKRAEPRVVPRVGRATELWSGQYNACAENRRGQIRCWGDSSYVQSGTRRRDRRARPTRLRFRGEVASMSIASNHGCLVTTEGELRCWGSNVYGAHGGTEPIYDTPQRIEELSDVRAFSTRSENMCAVSEGRVHCWGVNRQHHLFVPTEEMGQVVIHPSAVPGLSDATDVSVGWSAQCARRESGGWVCWGRNADGAVGVGSREAMVETPTPLPW